MNDMRCEHIETNSIWWDLTALKPKIKIQVTQSGHVINVHMLTYQQCQP